MRLLTIAGFVLGFFIVVVSTVRWYIMFNDSSKAFMGVCIGLIILGGSWLHKIIGDVMERQEVIDKQMNVINKFYTKKEWEK